MLLLPHTADELRSKLQHYIDNDLNYKKVFEYTRIRFNEDVNLTAHNWEHSYRDTLNAIIIGESEGADMTIVLPATTLHDIGFLYGATGRTHGAVGADKLIEFLAAADVEYSGEIIAAISSCIRTHKGSMHGEIPETIEAKVVADADMLEKFGPFGVYQYIRTFTEFNRSIDAVLERKLKVDKLTLETETGRKLAEPGREFVSDFFKELYESNAPYVINNKESNK